MKLRNFFTAVILFSIALSCNAESIQESHLNANLPDTYEDFLKIFERDVTAYFSYKEKVAISLKFELLRKQPTQSGLSYPKFYAWVKAYNNQKLLSEGAIRVTAIDKTKIEVTDFLSKQDINKKPNIIYSVFPYDLCKDIENRSKI